MIIGMALILLHIDSQPVIVGQQPYYGTGSGYGPGYGESKFYYL